MNAYGESLGINAGDVASHVSEFHDYWSQATKNATSLDWVKRWKVRFGQEVREGKVGAHSSNGRASPNGNGQYMTAAEKNDERLRRFMIGESDGQPTAISASVTGRGIPPSN
jgi:hypothetical protein